MHKIVSGRSSVPYLLSVDIMCKASQMKHCCCVTSYFDIKMDQEIMRLRVETMRGNIEGVKSALSKGTYTAVMQTCGQCHIYTNQI